MKWILAQNEDMQAIAVNTDQIKGIYVQDVPCVDCPDGLGYTLNIVVPYLENYDPLNSDNTKMAYQVLDVAEEENVKDGTMLLFDTEAQANEYLIALVKKLNGDEKN